MSKLIEVAKMEELKSGTMKAVMAEGHEILLARVGDKYYAVDGRCPHMKGDLSQGKLEGTVVTCLENRPGGIKWTRTLGQSLWSTRYLSNSTPSPNSS
jgi:hypothetical protein